MVSAKTIPVSTESDNTRITIYFSFTVGYSWRECGVNEVNAFLRSLGFTTREQVAAFCASRNIFKSFSTEEWCRQYIVDRDAIEISGYLGTSRNNAFFPLSFLIKTLPSIPNSLSYPSYNDFFQFLFTWITGGDSIERRNKYRSWWEEDAGLAPNAMNSSVLNKTVKNPWKLLNDGCPILKTFKDEVDNFINFEYGSKKIEGDSGSVLVDIAEGIQTLLLDLILREFTMEIRFRK